MRVFGGWAAYALVALALALTLALGACSLLAPSDAELMGGNRDAGAVPMTTATSPAPEAGRPPTDGGNTPDGAATDSSIDQAGPHDAGAPDNAGCGVCMMITSACKSNPGFGACVLSDTCPLSAGGGSCSNSGNTFNCSCSNGAACFGNTSGGITCTVNGRSPCDCN
jgi:hypothetical protein